MKATNFLIFNFEFLILIASCAIMTSCKKDNWLDWKAENTAFLEANKSADSIQVTPSGLQYKVIRAGIPNAAPKPDELKTVAITYTGRFINGYVFDKGDNARMSVAGTIEGFREGLKKMNVSGRYIFYIPYDLGYGESGNGTEGTAAYIPPYTTLIFDVTLNQCY